MSDRVDNEMRRIASALAEVAPPKPELRVPESSPRRRRPPLLVAVASFALVLGVGLVASLVVGGDPGVPPETGTTPEPGAGIVPIPDDHVVWQVLAEGSTFHEMVEIADSFRVESLCGSHQSTEVCALWENGVAVVVPFRVRDGWGVQVSSPEIERRLDIPVEEGELVGVSHDAGRFTLLFIDDGGEVSGSTSTYFPSSSAP